MKNKDQKNIEKAWNESIQLWKKRCLLTIARPNDQIEMEFAFRLQQSFQKRLKLAIMENENELPILPKDQIEHLAYKDVLLPPKDLLELYKITFYMAYNSNKPNNQKESVTVALRIIRQQRKFAEKTKEIHQRKNWTPV
ncbi:hypothetical protein [Candidatus Similichlamydia epinepheli]|uniref:hypothetical protein n=1 Tax=Candidatus Similichlamydia epinepheli TaxID=1903953 RepID=UPI000D3B2B8C|nr:hypothetical protein [Candidatus Similichlamydia epinepheli]